MVTNIKLNIMKKLSILLVSIIAFSCGEHENVIYDPNTSSTFTFFDSQTSAIEVLNTDISRSAEITVGVSTLSSSDRTVTLSVNEDLTTADSESYDVGTEVLIPANEYFGTVTITGYPDNLVTAEVVNIVLNIDSVSDGGVTSTGVHSVSLSIICPVDSAFAVGDYTLTFEGGGIAAAGNAPVWGDGTELRDLLYIEDFCEALQIVMENETENYQIYNIGCNEVYSVLDVLDKMKKIANYDAPIEFIKGKPSMIPTRRIDSNKIYDKLGWKATTSLEDGLKLAYEWYLAHKSEFK